VGACCCMLLGCADISATMHLRLPNGRPMVGGGPQKSAHVAGKCCLPGCCQVVSSTLSSTLAYAIPISDWI
jgi:hypothetical protein